MAGYLIGNFLSHRKGKKFSTKILVEDLSRSDRDFSKMEKWNHENKVGVANFFIPALPWFAIASARNTAWSVKPDRMEVNLRIHLEK